MAVPDSIARRIKDLEGDLKRLRILENEGRRSAGKGDQACLSGLDKKKEKALFSGQTALYPSQQPLKQGYYRQPALGGDVLVFLCQEQLYMTRLSMVEKFPPVPITGTVGASCASISPDGKTLAFSLSHRSGVKEVFSLPLSHRCYAPCQHTHFGAMGSAPAGWGRSSDSKEKYLFIRSPAQGGKPTSTQTFRVSISDDGASGEPCQVPLNDVDHILTSNLGRIVAVGRRTVDPHMREWRGYNGGALGELWIRRYSPKNNTTKLSDPTGTWVGAFRRILKDYHIGCPMLMESQGEVPMVLFVGCKAGIQGATANLYRCHTDGSRVTQVTCHPKFHVRHANFDKSSRKVTYSSGADIYIIDPSRSDLPLNPKPLPIAWGCIPGGMGRGVSPFVVPSAIRMVEEVAIHPDGLRVALIVRGTLWEMGTMGGPGVRLGVMGVRYSCVDYCRDGRIVVVADDGGKSIRLELHPTGLAARNELNRTNPIPFPTGKSWFGPRWSEAGPVSPPIVLSLSMDSNENTIPIPIEGEVDIMEGKSFKEAKQANLTTTDILSIPESIVPSPRSDILLVTTKTLRLLKVAYSIAKSDRNDSKSQLEGEEEG
ncbi:hypothetical protein AAMO2058_001531800, partial [Amorphochlora amoebiformis]